MALVPHQPLQFPTNDILRGILSGLEASHGTPGALAVDGGSFPPFNIVKTGEATFAIELAIAGLSADDIEVVQTDRVLTISHDGKADDAREYLHRGIARRAFRRNFRLGQDVVVSGASVADGLLTISLESQIPESRKPQRIEIGSRTGRTAAADA